MAPNLFTGAPTEKERLEQEVADLQTDLTVANNNASRDATTIVGLQKEVKFFEDAADIDEYAQFELQRVMESGEVMIAAEQDAKRIVTERWIARTAADYTQLYIDQQTAKWEEELATPERIEELRAKLAERLEEDGTLARIKVEVEAKLANERRDEVISEKTAEIHDELTTEEARDAAIAAITAELQEDGTFDTIRAEVTKRLKAELKDVATEKAWETIEAEILAGKQEMIEQKVNEILESNTGKQKRKEIEKRVRSEVNELSSEEAAARIENDMWQWLLAERAKREMPKLQEEIIRSKYLDMFNTTGIAVETIPEGTQMKIYLGEVTRYKETVKINPNDYYSGTKEVDRTQVEYKRQLELTATGDGRFRVEADSFLRSKNPYEKATALIQGTNIHIGRMVVDNGNKSLDFRIRQGVELSYDDDTTDNMPVKPMYWPVANVELEGYSARKDIDRAVES